ncbi:uncharacterized protein LOC126419568 [Schistocerca serialis cubense]|uniref:uncharacterized protein LOC126419568 n=1 Tax=Schistocerca serialis cubense TaxID=2023355 RepID=UPI00214EC609|nr:uncharacterized protein LOC126419568 [Schistocerca serialis cubense]
MAGKQIAAALEVLINTMGFTGSRQRQPRHKGTQRNGTMLQCYNCQQLGHTARGCKNTVACLKCAAAHDTRSCTKPRGVACSCVNCGGPHAANSRSCGYLRESRRLLAAPRPAVTSSASTAAPPPATARGASRADARAALKQELAAVHRQLQQLRDELRAIKKKPPVPAAAPAVSRPVGVDAATQTTAAPPPAAMQDVAPMETDDVKPQSSHSAKAAASKGAVAATDSSHAEKSTAKKSQLRKMKVPDSHELQPFLKNIAASIQDGSYPFEQPYPLTPAGASPPPPPPSPPPL